MNKKILISILIILILAVILIAVIIFYLLAPPAKPEILMKTPPTLEQHLEQIKKDYPQVVQGIINFLDTKNSFKSTIITADGKEYILWPSQPKFIYESLGIKNGQQVEVNAKSLNNAQLEWKLMKPL